MPLLSKVLFNSFGLKSSSVTALLHETQTLICEKDWFNNRPFQKSIETNLSILRSAPLQDDPHSYASDKQLFIKIDELYKRLCSFQEEIKAALPCKPALLKFSEVDKVISCRKRIQDIAVAYKAEASWKESMAATCVVNASTGKQMLARSSCDVWSGICHYIQNASMSVYVASKDVVVQGVAMTSVEIRSNKKMTHLKLLGTSPRNTPILGTEKNQVLRVGSMLIMRVIKEIRNNPELEKNLRLEADISAAAFYRKFGFTEKVGLKFELDEENMIKLENEFGKLKV